MKKRLFGGTIMVVLYIIIIIILWVGSSNAAEYATYMRVVSIDNIYIKVVDEEGQLWDVKPRDDSLDIRVGDNVLVIMDLQYHVDLGVFLIGSSYIQDKL